MSPLTNLELARIFDEVGLPKGVFQVITGPGGEEIDPAERVVLLVEADDAVLDLILAPLLGCGLVLPYHVLLLFPHH